MLGENASFVWAGFFFALVTFTLESSAAVCQKLDSCRCKQSDGTIIDLTFIGNLGGSQPQFDYAFAYNDLVRIYEFSFNGCHAYSDAFCTGVVACQRLVSTTQSGYPLGTPGSADFTDGTLLKFNAYDSSQRQRFTEVKLICDPTGNPDLPSLKVLGDPSNTRVAKYELTSLCACPDGCVEKSGGSSDDLSIGSILCITVAVLIVVYLVAGTIFMKYARGAEGTDIIPNYNIWIQIPGLIKDGTLYVVSLVKSARGEKTEYSEIE